MKRFLKVLLLVSIFVFSSLVFVGCGDDLILVTGVDFYKEEIYAGVSDTVDLSYKVYPSNATNSKVTFWSTDESVASVDAKGKVTVKAFGEASIIVRSVDGGFEDSCKIITHIDPEEIEWDSADGKLTMVSEEGYSATTAMALNQVMKLKINYLIDGKEDASVTNKNVKFKSSNTTNIEVIDEADGIIKAVNNEISEGTQAYSDITATIETVEEVLSITCRVYINEFSSLENLHIKYKNGNAPVLDQRNGSETIYLTSGGESIEFYSYITNMSEDFKEVKEDYTMTVSSGNPNLFNVDNFSYDAGKYSFTLIPSATEEGPGTLYITTTCSDESGKTIRCEVNVMVQAEIDHAKASATQRVSAGTEVLLNNEIFSIGLTYYDIHGRKIEGANRNIYFDPLTPELSNYISDYGDNQFKIKAVPSDINKIFTMTGYFYVENVAESSDRKEFEYNFYIRNKLEGLIVSEVEKETTLPVHGISSITLPVNGTKLLYVYATAYDFTSTQPATVSVKTSDSLVLVSKVMNSFEVSAGDMQGTTIITFVATDGLISIEYDVEVNIVASVASMKLYEGYTGGYYSTEISQTSIYETAENTLKVYIDVVQIDPNYKLESGASMKIEVQGATIVEEVDATNKKVYRYIEIDLSDLANAGVKTIEIKCARILETISFKVRKMV